jgi:NAD dependent epimerase/dehydratase
MKKILVTGAGGFIGSHLVEELVVQGYSVKAFVRYNSLGSEGWLDQSSIRNSVEVIAGDIRDCGGVKKAMLGCDVVFHLAALIGIPYSYESPEAYVDTNVKGTLNVLQAARELGVKRLVHTSTSEVYGTARFVPITEAHPLQAQSPYSASKIGADQIAISFFNSFNTPVVIVRPFNTYGPRQSTRAIIPTIITQIADGAKSVEIGSSHPIRDFNYVNDTVTGFIAAMKSSKAIGNVINIGSGYEVSIRETARLISKLMDVEVKLVTDKSRIRPKHSEVDRLCADNSKAKDLLKWNPRYAKKEGLMRGLKETIDWFLNPKNRIHYKKAGYHI